MTQTAIKHSSRVITWQSSRGNTLAICEFCQKQMESEGTWPKDRSGEEYASVSHGLHHGTCQLPVKSTTLNLTDGQIEKLYDDHRAQARGEAVGNDRDTPREAAEREGWTVLRTWNSRMTMGSNVLAEDAIGRIWGICDIEGPWAIQLGEDDADIEAA